MGGLFFIWILVLGGSEGLFSGVLMLYIVENAANQCADDAMR